MRKFSALILLPCVFALLTAARVEAAPITWDFVATGCTSNGQFQSGLVFEGCVPTQAYPAVLATLTLTGPGSSGSAVWNGSGSPSYVGDDFSLDFSSRYAPLTPAFAGNPPFGYCQAPTNICAFDLSWSESAGQLVALSLNVDGYNDDFGGSPNFTQGPPFGLTGGIVASDDTYDGVAGGGFAGCNASQCRITGYWVNDMLLTAPEPGSFSLLASAFGVWGLTGRRRVRRKLLHATT